MSEAQELSPDLSPIVEYKTILKKIWIKFIDCIKIIYFCVNPNV